MWLRGILAALALLLAGPAAALSISLESSGLDAVRYPLAESLVARTLMRLPPQWQADARVLPLRFDATLPEGVVGHHRRGRLRLSPDLLGPPVAGDDIDPAQAALIHEITHALDRGGARWSADPVFRRLIGWEGGRNDWSLRLPDAQVLQSPAESLAVHMEGFLLDPTYACRQPALATWLSSAVGTSTVTPADCPAALPFVTASGQGAGMAIEHIDPSRVWAVDYLLAGTGDGVMSHFGHSMLRLVICAPGRAPGPRCRMDLTHHRVLSYRAFVDDVQISSWRGLTGAYPSRLFVLPLDQVIDEYTRVELRDLTAHPLALDRMQVAAVVQAAAQAHWRYDGDYRFIDNNCAVETGRLLDTALMAQSRAGLVPARTQSITPQGVLRALHRQGWVVQAGDGQAGPGNADVVRMPSDAQRPDGLHFPSARAEYAQLLALLQVAGQIDPVVSLDRWLAGDVERRGDLPDVLTLEQAAAWLVLERAALRRSELRALGQLKRRWDAHTDLDAAVDDWRHWLGRADAPGAMPIGGYGVPQSAEVARAASMVAQWQTEGQARWSQLRVQAEAALTPEAQSHLRLSRERVSVLGRQVRELATH